MRNKLEIYSIYGGPNLKTVLVVTYFPERSISVVIRDVLDTVFPDTGYWLVRRKSLHWMKNGICTKFTLCKPVANIDFVYVCTHCVSGGCQVCTKCANLATTTYAMGANLCKMDICNRFAQSKVCANSIFHPVLLDTG